MLWRFVVALDGCEAEKSEQRNWAKAKLCAPSKQSETIPPSTALNMFLPGDATAERRAYFTLSQMSQAVYKELVAGALSLPILVLRVCNYQS